MTADFIGRAEVLAWFEGLRDQFARDAAALSDLDRLAGDGDFGFNMSLALDRVDAGLTGLPGAGVAEQLRAVSQAFGDNGGSSGPLLAAWFRQVAREASEAGLDLAGLASGARAGVDKIQALGGARVGDSTMIDALDPAAAALAGADTLPNGVRAAAAAARSGAAHTANLRARRGRASYVGDLSVGVQDPGAVFAAMLFEALDRAVR